MYNTLISEFRIVCMKKILIVEDDPVFSKILHQYLSRNGYAVWQAMNVKQALQLLSSEEFHLCLLDFNLPDGTGLDLLELIQSKQYKVGVIFMTTFMDVKTAVYAIKKGAVDYITKPIHQEELLMLIADYFNTNNTISNNTGVTKASTQQTKVSFIKGQSDIALQVYKYADLVAPTLMNVMIIGESGTGKEHIAKYIHSKSERSKKAFVAIDCGALSQELANSELFGHVKGAFTGALQDKKGQFEMANGGTIFLDEVGNLSYEVQVKLLRAIQEKEIQPVGSNNTTKVDVRIITATNEDFQSAISNNSFREDLFHRINEFKIKMPALRDRISDMEELVAFFIQKSNHELNKNFQGIDPAVNKLLQSYHWPGNIRELQNIIKRAVLLATSSLISVHDLPDEMEAAIINAQQNEFDVANKHSIKAANAVNEKALIVQALVQHNYNKSKAAKQLQIDRTTLYNKMRKFGITDS